VTQTVSYNLSLPAVPRPLTRHVVRRSWGEPKVRFWWLSAILIGVVMAFVAAGQIRRELKHRRLIATGALVNATAFKVAGVTRHQNPNFGVMRDQTIAVEFSALLPNGKEIIFGGYLEPAEGRVRVDQVMKLRVDPNDLSNWSEDINPQQWTHVLGVPLFFMLPVALLLLGIGEWRRRRRVLAVWSEGARGTGVVVGVRHSAAAPRSRVVEFTFADGADRRVFRTLYPLGAGIPSKGDMLTLLYPVNSPQDSIIAELYVRPADLPPHPPPLAPLPQPPGFEVMTEDRPTP
jgi:hypothetical protein